MAFEVKEELRKTTNLAVELTDKHIENNFVQGQGSFHGKNRMKSITAQNYILGIPNSEGMNDGFLPQPVLVVTDTEKYDLHNVSAEDKAPYLRRFTVKNAVNL